MMKAFFLILTLAVLACNSTKKTLNTDSFTPTTKPEFQAKEFQVSDASTLKYNIYNPATGEEKLPLLVFLHGAGERGDDNKAQLMHIAPILTNDFNVKEYPAILVFPQCPEEDYWANVNRDNDQWTVDSKGTVTPPMSRVIELITELRKNKNVDLDRIYISGLSMGGFGTLDLISRHSDWFAAAVAICGGGDLAKTNNYKGLPLWVFHGAKDPVVPVSLSRDLVAKIQKEEGSVKYTEYPEGGHDVWNKAYENPETLEWLFSQSRD